MALVQLPAPIYYGPRLIRDNTGSTAQLNANGEYVAWIIQAPKTGTIDRLHFHATVAATQGDGLRCRIETVSASDGLPSGSLAGGGAEVTVATTAVGWNRSGAGLGCAVTRGDLIAVIVASPGTGSTTDITIRYGFGNLSGPGVNNAALMVPYTVVATPTGTKGAPGAMVFAVEYDDGTTPYIESVVPASAATSTNFNSSSSPDERGNLFQVVAPMRVIGVYHQTLGAASTTYDLVLYDASNSVLASVSVDGDQYRTTGVQPVIHFFPTPVELAAGTNYRIACLPTTTTNLAQLRYTIDTSTGGDRLREAAMIGAVWQHSARADAATTGGTLGDGWTQTADDVAALGLIVDQIDDGTSVGGGDGVPYIIGG